MQIVRDLAGYSMGRSDLVRRAMAKKKHDVMAQEKEYFIHGKLNPDGSIDVPGAVRRGVSEQVAEHLFEEIADLNVVVDDKNVFRHLSSRSAPARDRPCAQRRAKTLPIPAALRFP